MVRIITIALILFSQTIHANTNIEFKQAKIHELIATYSKSILKQDYIIAPEIYSDNTSITISLRNKTEPELLSIFNDFLSKSNITTRKLAGTTIYEKQNKTDIIQQPILQQSQQPQQPPVIDLNLQVEVYRPKNRTPVELAEILALFNVTAHTKNNEYLLFSVPEKNKANLQTLLEKIDLPQNQFEVIAATYEVSTIDDSQRSIDIIGNIFKNLSLSIVTSGASNLIKYTGGSLVNAFKFFDTDTRFRSISKPYGIVKSGSKLTFNSGQDVPTLGAITTNNNITQQSVEYRQSGVLLDVDLNAVQDVIDIKINHELSNFIQTKTGVNNSPTLNKRSLKTNLTIKDGEIVIIGGISDLSTTKSNSSALGLVPIEKTKGNKQTETYIFLQVSKI